MLIWPFLVLFVFDYSRREKTDSQCVSRYFKLVIKILSLFLRIWKILTVYEDLQTIYGHSHSYSLPNVDLFYIHFIFEFCLFM